MNTTGDTAPGFHVQASVYSLSGKQLQTREAHLDLLANKAQPLFPLPQEGTVLVILQLSDSQGTIVSRNAYWLAGEESGYRKLNTFPPATLTLKASAHESELAELMAWSPETTQTPAEEVLDLDLTNSGSAPALATKLTLLDAGTHERILPAFYSDNYVSLLPGETAHLTTHYPAGHDVSELGVRGWNAADHTVKVSAVR